LRHLNQYTELFISCIVLYFVYCFVTNFIVLLLHTDKMKAWTRKKAKSRQSRQSRRGGMFRHALKNAAKKVFTGKNPVETADKVKQAADAIIQGTTSTAVMHRVTPQKSRIFSFSLSGSSPINYSTNSPITYEFQPQTPVKPKPSDTIGPLLPKLPRHRRRDPISYAPRYGGPINVIRSKLFD